MFLQYIFFAKTIREYTYKILSIITLSGPKRWETNNFVSFIYINFYTFSHFKRPF